ncbi:MAG: hypothetical protein IJO92_04700 [Clostridia bacterium]|nr:hypothetical protein [Clostridia bacterium]
MKKFKNNLGIAPWKIDHPIERWLSWLADRCYIGKILYVNFYKVFDKDYYVKGLSFIEKNIQVFAGAVSNKQKKNYIYDMVYSLHRFGCMFDEYFLFDFPHLNTLGRDSFLTDKNRWKYYSCMNIDANKAIFDNKRKAYEIFRKYYKRELIEIIDDNDLNKFCDFAERHRRFIVKPIAGSGGKGVSVVSTDQYKDITAMFTDIRKKGAVVVEELVCQVDEMAALHPSSLNSVRVPTLKLKDRIVIYRPFLRIGRGNSIVDNAASGGVFVAVDADTGICSSEGVDELGNRYLRHPDTGIVLPGFRIPRWDEAVALVKELAEIIEGNRYVGWDLALTEDGWKMIEGNPCGQFVIQIATQKGIKKEIEDYIARM